MSSFINQATKATREKGQIETRASAPRADENRAISQQGHERKGRREVGRDRERINY